MEHQKKMRKDSVQTLSTSGVKLMPSTGIPASCCGSEGGQDEPDAYERPALESYVDTFISTPVGKVPVVRSRLNKQDLISTALVRCGVGRDRYRVAPGLYAVGRPHAGSEVLVTASFKLTFDHLRTELDNIDAWILVLDTRGVNVWCAAGKGTFSTRELVRQIRQVRLDTLVSHRRLIVPQLGATGVAAGQVKQESGFRVVFGPVRAKDISAFLTRGRKADEGMRQVTFTMYERFILTPVELKIALKPALIAALLLFIVSGMGPVFSFSSAFNRGMTALTGLVAGIFAGAIATPVLLPFIPCRRFALKGIIAGGAVAVIPAGVLAKSIGVPGITALALFVITISSFLAMNFTGATPFTSPSGVEKEMKQFIPVQAGAMVLSAGLWIYSAF